MEVDMDKQATPHRRRAAAPALVAALALTLAVVSGPAAHATGSQPAAKAPARSLYERLGGAPALQAVVDDFVAAAAADPQVDFTRGGQWRASDANVQHLKKQLVDFMGQAFGGPQVYAGRSMKDAHRGMAITQAQFDALAGHLKATLAKHKVAQAEIDEVMAIAASTAPDIVEKR
jgi:hemoglobin